MSRIMLFMSPCISNMAVLSSRAAGLVVVRSFATVRTSRSNSSIGAFTAESFVASRETSFFCLTASASNNVGLRSVYTFRGLGCSLTVVRNLVCNVPSFADPTILQWTAYMNYSINGMYGPLYRISMGRRSSFRLLFHESAFAKRFPRCSSVFASLPTTRGLRGRRWRQWCVVVILLGQWYEVEAQETNDGSLVLPCTLSMWNPGT